VSEGTARLRLEQREKVADTPVVFYFTRFLCTEGSLLGLSCELIHPFLIRGCESDLKKITSSIDGQLPPLRGYQTVEDRRFGVWSCRSR